jgi:hypothetical protein
MSVRNKVKSFHFESLEERSVLAASAFAAIAKSGPTLAANAKLREVAPPAFFAPPSVNVKAAFPSLPSMGQLGSLISTKGSPQTLTETRLSATIVDPTGTNTAVGFARYQSATINNVVHRTFTVTVSGAVAGIPLTVNVGGVEVGTITPNSEGNGKLSFATTPKNGQSVAFPANFPATIVATTSVKIGVDLTGSFTALPNKPFVPRHDNGLDVTNVVRLGAALSDPTAASTLKSHVSYSSATINGTVMSAFRVCVSGGTAGQEVDVTISSTDATTGVVTTTSVGKITLDAKGRGQLLYTTNPSTKGFAVAFPANFPTSITAGMTVGVDTLTATLAAVTGRPGKR